MDTVKIGDRINIIFYTEIGKCDMKGQYVKIGKNKLGIKPFDSHEVFPVKKSNIIEITKLKDDESK